jgi:hypothetical protein
MNAAWAVDLLRRGAVEFMQREIQRPKLYDALDYLEKTLDEAWLVRRYRRALRGDCPHWRDRREKREKLRVAARGIQQACAEIRIADGTRTVPIAQVFFGHDVGTGVIYQDANIKMTAVENSHFDLHKGPAYGNKSYSYRKRLTA